MTPEQYPHAVLPETSIVPPLASEHLPRELFAYPQWICWRYVARGEGKKPDKQPVNPRTLGNAGVKWPNTWCSFEQALSTYTLYQERGVAGLGFVLTHDDPFVGLDLDTCVVGGEIAMEAQEVVARIASYTEISPSLQGLRIFVSCPDFKKNVRTARLEVYAHSRFLTLTGLHVDSTPRTIASVPQETLTALLLQPEAAHEVNTPRDVYPVSDAIDPMGLWTRIFEHDQYGAQHLRRFQGDTSLDRGDHSLTVIRLLNAVARWTDGDATRMRQMMLLSPLANEKWFSKRGKGDWLNHQIRDAITFIKRGKA